MQISCQSNVDYVDVVGDDSTAGGIAIKYLHYGDYGRSK